ncbi:MAG: hypothetical protein Q9212_007202 [Teloschistes hypoglaucus]
MEALDHTPRSHSLPKFQWLYPLPPNQPTSMLPDGQNPAGEEETTAFPFEKLPEELRLRVLEFALPEYGFLPRSARYHTPSQHYIGVVRESDFTAENLILANKWISTEMWNLIRKRATHYIVLTCDKVRFLHQTLVLADKFHSHLTFARLPFFRDMQHYHLDLDLGTSHSIYKTYESRRSRLSFQEHLRTVADALSMNEDIRSLTVAVPCHCSIEKFSNDSHQVELTSSNISDLLAPLKRIRARDPIQLIPYNESSRREYRLPCPRAKCLRLAQLLTAELSHFSGESLTDAEERWKWRKTLLRLREEREYLAEWFLDYGKRKHTSFEEMVEGVERCSKRMFNRQVPKELRTRYYRMLARARENISS